MMEKFSFEKWLPIIGLALFVLGVFLAYFAQIVKAPVARWKSNAGIVAMVLVLAGFVVLMAANFFCV